MPNKNIYPERITYYGVLMSSRISLVNDCGFRMERRLMRENIISDHTAYFDEARQNMHLLQYSEADEGFVNDREGILKKGEYNFILTCEENPRLIYADTSIHHSALANGKKVLASGCLFFDSGDLIAISNNSGHYCPTDDEMLGIIKALYRASSGTLVSYYSYCSDPSSLYLVKELINVESISQASPVLSYRGRLQDKANEQAAKSSYDNSQDKANEQVAKSSYYNSQDKANEQVAKSSYYNIQDTADEQVAKSSYYNIQDTADEHAAQSGSKNIQDKDDAQAATSGHDSKIVASSDIKPYVEKGRHFGRGLQASKLEHYRYLLGVHGITFFERDAPLAECSASSSVSKQPTS